MTSNARLYLSKEKIIEIRTKLCDYSYDIGMVFLQLLVKRKIYK